MKVTARMVGRWVKAVFLVIIALVLALYGEGFIADFEDAFRDEPRLNLEETWFLLTVLMWILVAWLLVLAILTVVMSLKEDEYTMSDVMARLRAIEKRLGPRPAPRVTDYTPGPAPAIEAAPVIEEEQPLEPMPVEEEPPPPNE